MALFLAVLSGCADVKTLSPLSEETSEEESAVLIIPSTVTVKRIDGARRRGFIKIWSVGYLNRGEKTATLLVPAGEHTVIFDFDNMRGLSARNLEYMAEMRAGKMYMVSAGQEENVETGVFIAAVNGAVSALKRKVIDIIPFIELLPSPNPTGMVYMINEVDQAAFDQYVLEAKNDKSWIPALVAGLLLLLIISALRVLWHRVFMGRLMNRIPIPMVIICGGILVLSFLIINYNTSGNLSLYLLVTLLISIAGSAWDLGGSDNKKGMEKLNDRNYKGAVLHFNTAIYWAPHNANYINNRGIAYLGLQDYRSSISDFTHAIRLNPNNQLYKDNLATAQAQAGNQAPQDGSTRTSRPSRKKSHLVRNIIIAAVAITVLYLAVSFVVGIAPQFLGLFSNKPASASQTAAAATTATVTADSLNFRSAPSTSGSIIKTLSKGDTLTVTGSTENGWVPVKHGNDAGYVSADLVSISIADGTYTFQPRLVASYRNGSPSDSHLHQIVLHRGNLQIFIGNTPRGAATNTFSREWGELNATLTNLDNPSQSWGRNEYARSGDFSVGSAIITFVNITGTRFSLINGEGTVFKEINLADAVYKP
jgi:hypothetical protein